MDDGTQLGVGVNTMSFMWRASAQSALETLAREGYQRFEVMAQTPHFDPMMSASDAKSFGRFLKDAGLHVETVNLPSLDLNMAAASPEMRAYSVDVYERLVTIAATIGAEAIIVVTGRVNPLISPARADLEGWFGESFSRVLRAAQGAGVRLLLENIPIGVFPTAPEIAAFASRFPSSHVGICYDIANAHYIGEDVVRCVHEVRDRLGIVHLSDTHRDRWRHDPVGQGSCDFEGFGRALDDTGYTGTSMLEIVAEQAVEQIVASHHRVAKWGWAAAPNPDD